MKLCLVRHGQTIGNRDRIVQGWLPGVLTEEGKHQARQTAEQLSNLQFDRIYTSDLARAYDTARIIADYHNQEVIAEQRLREYNFGIRQGQSVSSWYDPASVKDRLHGKVEGGESAVDVSRRVAHFLNELIQSGGHNNVLAVTHGGIIRIAISLIEDRPLGEVYATTDVGNAQVFNYEITNLLPPEVTRW